MEKLSLYDAAAPIVCTLKTAEIEGRIGLIERLRSALTHLERTEHGLLLHFPRDARLEEELRAFSLAEKGCCNFWGFDVRAEPQSLTLRWDGPPASTPILERLAAFFVGNEPAAALKGIL